MATEKIQKLLYNGEVDITFFPNSHRYKIGKETLMSVSSISGIVDKSNALIYRATNLSKEYLLSLPQDQRTDEEMVEACKQHTRKKDEACNIGNQVHERIENHIKEIEQEIPEDEKVRNGIVAFLEWEKNHEVTRHESERLVYSKENNYVGICDAITTVDGKLTVVDFKTSKNFYPLEMGMQVAGYRRAYEEETHEEVQASLVLRFDKETGDFESHELTDTGGDREAFKSALVLKKRQKLLK